MSLIDDYDVFYVKETQPNFLGMMVAVLIIIGIIAAGYIAGVMLGKEETTIGVRYEIVYNHGNEVRTLYTNKHWNHNGYTTFIDLNSGYETKIPVSNVITITKLDWTLDEGG